jgi:hypothetical protein
MRVNGCPVFQIFDPVAFPHVDEFIKLWNQLINEAGLQRSSIL